MYVQDPSPPNHHLDTRAICRRAYRFQTGGLKPFGNSADAHLKVHRRDRSQADVTEGLGGIWERLHYDWSDPNRVVLTTTDSNLWGGASGHNLGHLTDEERDYVGIAGAFIALSRNNRLIAHCRASR